MKKIKQFIATLIFCCCSVNTFANDNIVLEFTTPSIDYRDFLSELARGNLKRVKEMLSDEIYRQLYEDKNREKTWRGLLNWVGSSLQDLINDPNITDEEKGLEILNLIASTIEPYSASENNSGLNLKLEHSVIYDTTFLSWEDLVKTDSCKEGYFKRVCDDFSCYSTWTYRRDILTQVPDYHIYRVVDGRSELITTIKGLKHLKRGRTISFSSNQYGQYDWKNIFRETSEDLAKEFLIRKFQDYFSDETAPNRRAFTDLMSVNRNKGESVSYKIVANNGAYKGHSCGHNNTWTTTVVADSDGDLRMDFIPEEVYDGLFTRLNPWFVPAISSTLF